MSCSMVVVFALSLAASVVLSFIVTATTEIYTLSLHDALPIWRRRRRWRRRRPAEPRHAQARRPGWRWSCSSGPARCRCRTCPRSEEHTSELQSRLHLVCRLLLEKKNELVGPIIAMTITLSAVY